MEKPYSVVDEERNARSNLALVVLFACGLFWLVGPLIGLLSGLSILRVYPKSRATMFRAVCIFAASIVVSVAARFWYPQALLGVIAIAALANYVNLYAYPRFRRRMERFMDAVSEVGFI